MTDGDDLSLGADSVDFSAVEVGLDHLNLIPVKQASNFTIKVAGGDDAELAVSVQGTEKNNFLLFVFPVLFFIAQ